jgi:hypothetical protein
MAENDFKSAVTGTLSNIIAGIKDTRAKNTLDENAFIEAIKKELLKNDLPFFNVSKSKINRNIIILELPFTKTCEISVTPTMFTSTHKNEAAIKINGILTRRIRLQQLDSAYMNQVATALVDYLKRFLIVKNKITTKS